MFTTFNASGSFFLAHATNTEKNDFLKEIELMKKIAENYNNNVVNLLGAVTIKEPMLLVIEFVEHGDLLSYLRYCKKRVCLHQDEI